MPVRVDLVKVFRHPRTNQRLSERAAERYNKRAKKKIRPELWIVARHVVGDTQGLHPAVLAQYKKMAGKIAYQSKLTEVKKVLSEREFSERRVDWTLRRSRVLKKMYEDFEAPSGRDIQRRGSIRMTVNGFHNGRRIKEVIHLPFLKSAFGKYARTEEEAFEEFQEWVIGSVISNLRRRGLRLSNQIESAKRINDLDRNRKALLKLLEFERRPEKQGGLMERIKWASVAMNQQQKSKQLKGATIRIEKII